MNIDIDCHQVINSLQEPLIIVDGNYRICEVNNAFCVEHKVSCESVVGKHCYEFAHHLPEPCWESGVPCPSREVFGTGQPLLAVHQHHLPDGTSRWEQVAASPIRDETGQVVYVVEELRDLTDLLKNREIIEHLTSEVRTLRGMLPICAACKRIRNDKGYWEQLEVYLRDHSDAEFSHGLCPDCAKRLYPDLRIE